MRSTFYRMAAVGLLVVSAVHGADNNPAFTNAKEAGPDFAIQGEYAGAAGDHQWGAQVIALGDSKFDLTKWDNAYFARLRGFVSEASKRGIVVELDLFCPFYEDAMWNPSPMHAANNVNGLGIVTRSDVYTLDRHGG